MSAEARVAGCACGQLRLSFAGDPKRVSVCHCFECQRRSESVFGVQCRFDHAQLVSKEGASKAYTRRGDSGTAMQFNFCETCGSTVYWEHPALPGSLVVAAGAFADPTLGAPTYSVYEERMHPWVKLDGPDIEHHP